MYSEFSILLIASCALLASSFNAIEIGYNSDQQDYECPSMCVCDLFMDLNRANCRFGLLNCYHEKTPSFISFRFQSSAFDWCEH